MQKDRDTEEEMRVAKSCFSEGVRRAENLRGIPSPSSLCC